MVFIFDNYTEILWIVLFKTFSQTEKRPTVLLVLLEVDLMPYVNPHVPTAIISGCYESAGYV